MPTPIIPPQPPEYALPPEPTRPGASTPAGPVWDLWFAWARLKDAQVRRELDYQREVMCVTAQWALADATQAHADAYLMLPPVDQAAVQRSLRTITAYEAEAVAINALAVAITGRAVPVPAPAPAPGPSPAPVPVPVPAGLVAETVAVARAWAAAYAPVAKAVALQADGSGPPGEQSLPPAKKPQVGLP